MGNFFTYIKDSAPAWLGITFLSLVVGGILVTLTVVVIKTIKGKMTINLWGLKFESLTLVTELQKQVDDLTEINEHKAQVLKLLNQTILTVPKWESVGYNTLKDEIQSFYSFFLPGIASLMTNKKGNSVRVAILTLDGDYLKIAHGSGYSPEGFKNLKLRLSSSSAGYCYTSKEKYHSDDVSLDPRYKRNPKSSRQYFSLICIPIQYEDEVIGILNVDGLKRKSFDRDDLDHLSYFASALAPLLKKEFEYKEQYQKEAL